jgi:hypothetical protein
MNLDQELRTMLRQRAEGVQAAPVVPDRTVRRVRVRKAVWAAGTLAVVVTAVIAGTLAIRSTILTDAAPLPPANQGERAVPPPPEDFEGTLVSAGYHESEPWWLGTWIDGQDFLCVSVLVGDGRGGSGCGPGPGPGEQRGITPSTFSGELFTPSIVYGTVRSDIERLELIERGTTQSTETIAAPRDFGEDVRFFIFFASSPERIVGYDAAGDSVAEVDVERAPRGPIPGAEEVVGRGTVRGVEWSLTATPLSTGLCYGFGLDGRGDGRGGSACVSEPGPEWFGEASQEVDPKKLSLGPVYGAIPATVDEVRVVLDDDGDIPAVILRPEGHRFAYYLAWLPDPYASGEVRFASGSQVLGARKLCASDVLERSDRRAKNGFSCTGRVRAP